MAGYYSLAMAAIPKDAIPERWQNKYPRFALPVARLGRLAVDESHQGRGIGALLLLDALHRAMLLSDAKDETAARFYQHFDRDSSRILTHLVAADFCIEKALSVLTH